MALEKLTRQRIVNALNLLGQLAEREEVELELCIYGGSAMMLAYGSRPNTKDVDAVVRPSETAKRLAVEVGQKLGLHASWLNDDVKQFLSENGTFAPLEVEELETTAKRHLRITRPSASYLLAMKCLACRSGLPGYPGDIEDIRFLIRKMNIRTLAQIEEHLNRFYPFDALTPTARSLIQSVLPDDRQ